MTRKNILVLVWVMSCAFLLCTLIFTFVTGIQTEGQKETTDKRGSGVANAPNHPIHASNEQITTQDDIQKPSASTDSRILEGKYNTAGLINELSTIVRDLNCSDKFFKTLMELQTAVYHNRFDTNTVNYLSGILGNEDQDKTLRQLVLAVLGRSKSEVTRPVLISQIYNADEDFSSQAVEMFIFDNYDPNSALQEERMFWWEFIAHDFYGGRHESAFGRKLRERYLLEINGLSQTISDLKKLLNRNDISLGHLKPNNKAFIVPTNHVETRRRNGKTGLINDRDRDVKDAMLTLIREGRIGYTGDYLDPEDKDVVDSARRFYINIKDNPIVKRMLLNALSSMNNPTAISDLKTILTFENEFWLRESTLRRLSSYAEQDLIIYNLIQNEYSVYRFNQEYALKLIDILGYMKTLQSIKILEDLYAIETEEVRKHIGKYLGK